MITFAIVNALTRLLVQPLSNRLQGFDSKKEEMMLRQIETKHKLDLETTLLSKELDFNNQVRLQEISHRNRLEEAVAQIKTQYNMQYKLWVDQQTDSRIWPLNTPFGSPLLDVDVSRYNHVPLTIFMTKAKANSDFVKNDIESIVLDHLNNYLTQAYNADGYHAIIPRINDWKGGRQYSSDILTLWHVLKGQPCLIISPMPTESNKNLELNINMWGLGAGGQDLPTAELVVPWNYLLETRKALRNQTKAFIEINEKYNSLNYDKKGAIASNIEAYKEELQWREKGASDQEIEKYIFKKYKPCVEFQDEVFLEMGKNMANTICCVAGVFADIYHLLEYGTYPIMPYSINKYSENRMLNWDIPPFAIDYYRKTLTNLACTGYLQESLSNTFLLTAHTLSYDIIQCREIFEEGVWLWANRKRYSPIQKPSSIEECVSLIQQNIGNDDIKFLDIAIQALDAIGEHDASKYLEERIGGHLIDPPRKGYKCQHCGEILDKDSKFCSHCGRTIDKGSTCRCEHCGGIIDLDSKFCIHCGIELWQ
jgi:hypothetical protein